MERNQRVGGRNAYYNYSNFFPQVFRLSRPLSRATYWMTPMVKLGRRSISHRAERIRTASPLDRNSAYSQLQKPLG